MRRQHRSEYRSAHPSVEGIAAAARNHAAAAVI
jgi:hypothetical protein